VQVPLYAQLAIALGLGLLVGFQRERAGSAIAGIRTFALITLLGAVAALLAQPYGAWTIAAGWIALGAIVVVANVAKLRSGEVDPGLTTEAAALLMFGVGALVVTGPVEMALAAGGAVAILLHFKAPLHQFVERVGEGDVGAIMRFVLITLVILPVLPDTSVGPYGVWNPFRLWLMVVLIVGIQLGGYVAYKLVGARGGTLMAGVLGGLISSTATTVGYARRAAGEPKATTAAAAVIGIAGTVVFARLAALVAAVAPHAFRSIAPPLLAVGLAAGAAAAVATWRAARGEAHDLPEQSNPAELRPALLFAAIFAVVLLLSAFAREHLGSQALYALAIVSGVADVDAITLSTLQLVGRGLDAEVAWRVVIVAALSNLVFKAGTVAALGPRALAVRVGLLFLAPLAAGLLVVLVGWPGRG